MTEKITAKEVLATGQGIWAWLRIVAVIGAVASMWFGLDNRVAAVELENARRRSKDERIEQQLQGIVEDIAVLCTGLLGADNCIRRAAPEEK